MINNANKGFVLVCKKSGALDSVIRDDYNIFSSKGNSFYEFFDQENKSDLKNFLSDVHDFRSIFNNKLKIKEQDQLTNFYIAGAPYFSNAIIIGSPQDEFSDFYYEVKEKLATELNDLDQIVDEKFIIRSNEKAGAEDSNFITLQESKNRLRLKEKALHNKDKELEHFAHIVSHDLKAPLSQSKLIVHLLGKKIREGNYSKDILELFDMLLLSTNHMSDLIDSIQLYSKSGYLVQEFSHFSLSDLLAEVVSKIDVPAGFDIQFEQNLPLIYSNKMHLFQVLLQLIRNGIRFHHKSEGNIFINFSEEQYQFNFEVIDDGPGIPEEYHQRIFEIFNNSNLRSEKVGTGVGLSIVKKLIEASGGTISLDSKVGRGSNFKFSWPKSREETDINRESSF